MLISFTLLKVKSQRLKETDQLKSASEKVCGKDRAFESTLPIAGRWPGYKLVWHELKRITVSSIV